MSDKPSPQKDTANVSSDKAKIAPSSASSRAEKEHTKARRSQGTSGWIKLLTGINFIALIGAGAAGFWGWQQWQAQQSQWVLQPQLQQAQNQLTQSLDQAENQFSSGLKQVEQSFSQQLASTNSALQTTRRDVEQISGRRPNQWLMAEAEYL
ncbi:MAG: hypothetical protein OIF34_11265, partial [Porticoccaceae bacterium]|nr:hypothetical protein [Porticoccaceae bacterium]